MQRQKAVIKAEALQSAIFTSASFSIIATDENGVIQLFNLGAQRMLGYTAADVVNKINLSDIYDPQEVLARAQALSHEFATPIAPGFESLAFKASRGIEDSYDLTYIRKDGSRFPATELITALRNDAGAVIGYLLAGTDITQRKLSETALRESEAFNRSIIKSSPDCIKVLDLDGNLLSMQSGQELLGIDDIRPFLNKAWIEFWDGEHRLAAQAAIALALTGKVGNFVGFFRTLRGEPKWWDVAVTPILDINGQPRQLLAVSRDVTQRRQAELNFEFLASVSRDLVHWTNVDEMMQAIGAKVAAHLQLSLCAFVEIDETAEQVVIQHDWHRADVPTLVGAHRLADFVEEEFIRMARAEEVIVVHDVANDLRTDPKKFTTLKIASFICAPLIRDGQWRFALCLYKDTAYDWRTDEIELARELTARIWTRLERLRAEAALRQSEQRYRMLFESIDEGFCIIEKVNGEAGAPSDFRYVEANRAFQIQSGMYDVVGKTIRQLIPGITEEWFLTYDAVLRTRESIRFERELVGVGTKKRFLELYVFPIEADGCIAVIFKDITQRKEAEQALRTSEERSRAFITASSDAVYRMSADWVEMCHLDGRNFIADSEKSNPNWLQEYIFPDDQPQVLAAINESIRTKGIFDLEHRVRRADGSVGWTSSRAVPLLDARGEIVEWFGAASDVTKRKQATQALRESEERFRAAVNIVSSLIWTNNADGLMEGEQPGWGNFTGQTQAEYQAYGWCKAVHPDDAQPTLDAWEKAVAEKRLFEFEHRVRRRNGEWRLCSIRAVPLLGGDGVIREWVGVHTDITERKRNEDAIRESEQRYRELFDSMDEGFCIIEMIYDEHQKPVDWRYLEVNPSFEKQTGILNITGKRIRELAPDHEQYWFETYGNVVLTGEPIRFVNEAKAVDNRWFDLYAFQVGGRDSRKLAVLFTDITERKQYEVNLNNAVTIAQKASLAKSQFLSSMSHELRTPLNAILGFAQLLEIGIPPLTPAQQLHLDEILKGGWYLLDLINEILDLAVIESGKVGLSWASVPVEQIILECRTMIEPQAHNRGVSLTFAECDAPYLVKVDYTRIKQVLLNLLVNAIKYNRTGGTVAVVCTPKSPDSIRISIRDTGVGLDPSQLAQLFQPFNRLGKETGPERGTGIGLVVSKQLVELMGGAIGAESELGVGSVFWIDLNLTSPPERISEQHNSVTLARPDPLPVLEKSGTRTLLYIEDNPANLKLVEQLVARRPHLRLLSALDGDHGIALARAHQPEVILMDITLPGITGIEAMQILRADPATAHIPIVALSANAMPRDIESGLEAGFFRYLTKPINVNDLMDTLNVALEFTETTQEPEPITGT